jgi:hypothetical protein
METEAKTVETISKAKIIATMVFLRNANTPRAQILRGSSSRDRLDGLFHYKSCGNIGFFMFLRKMSKNMLIRLAALNVWVSA